VNDPVTSASARPLPDPETAREWLQTMSVLRRFDERAGELYGAGQIGGFAQCEEELFSGDGRRNNAWRILLPEDVGRAGRFAELHIDSGNDAFCASARKKNPASIGAEATDHFPRWHVDRP